MKHIVLAALFGLAGITASHAQNKVDALQIYRNFIASAVAQSKCGAADQAVDAQFLSNLATVTVKVAHTLKERNPTASDDALLTTMDVASDRAKGEVLADFNANGCKSPTLQKLVRLYKVHADMRLGG